MTRARAPVVAGILLLIVGAAQLLLGGALVAVGGSWWPAVFGLAIAVAGILSIRHLAVALGLHALVLALMLVWSIAEAGFDWWPLAARVDLAFVLGVVLVLPVVTRALAGSRVNVRALQGVLVAAVVVGIAAAVNHPHEIDGALATAAASPAPPAAASVPAGEWQAYGRTAYGQRYSPLTQITPGNVDRLKIAWTYRTGDVRGRPGDPEETTYEVTPLEIGNRLFLCTPHQYVIALDATSGKELWRYDPHVAILDRLALQHLTCRGLSYEPAPEAGSVAAAASAPSAPSAAPGRPVATQGAMTRGDCTAKLFMATADARIIALDPQTGAVCTRFGGGSGQIDLEPHMPNLKPGSYYSTSPPVVTKKLLIVGGTVLDNYSTREESGVIRAFDIDSGALVWNWDSGNPEATAPIAAGQTYVANSPNSWSTASVDEALGLVYLPIGNQPPDQFGGHRSPAVERFSSSVVALDLATGQVRWVFQTVHHDLWDYDVPSQPSLVDLAVAGTVVPALVQPTKQGELFVLDRRTGTPLLPVTEQPAPAGAAAGDHTSPTQPRSGLSFDPPPLTEASMWGATILDQTLCRIDFRRLKYGGRFTPPSAQGSLVYPGNFGVFNWGSIAVDPQRGIAFTTPTYLPFISQLVPRPDDHALMVQANGQKPPGALPALNENFGAPYAARLEAFLSPLGVPCNAPPWGYVAGVDLRSGRIVWRHRNGTVRDLSPIPVPLRMGVPNLGGPVVTAGGVAFLSGTMDYYVRGYDVTSGRQLWRSRLPAGAQATPMTYLAADGRQMLVVVAGGHGSTHTKPGDYVIAYSLPSSTR